MGAEFFLEEATTVFGFAVDLVSGVEIWHRDFIRCLRAYSFLFSAGVTVARHVLANLMYGLERMME